MESLTDQPPAAAEPSGEDCSKSEAAVYYPRTKQETMSYSILYNKMFVKVTDDQYIPMIQCGDNNVYESDRKRARSWWNHRYVTGGPIWASSGTIIGTIDRIREERIASNKRYIEQNLLEDGDLYDDKRFGWHEGIAIYGKGTTGTTFGMYRNFYKTGIERALTIEQLLEHGIQLRMKLYSYRPEDVTDKGKEIKPDVTFTSTEHLVSTVNEWVEYYGEMSDRISLWYWDDWGIEKLTKSQRKSVKREAKWVESKSYYALKSSTGYFIKNLRYGYRYAYTSTGAKKFLTEKEANAFKKRMKNGGHFEVELNEHPYAVSVKA
jgi:hypothetical protein